MTPDLTDHYEGRITRYETIAKHIRPLHIVNDIGCGDGIGSTVMLGKCREYHGYDETVTWPEWMPGDFRVAALQAPGWRPDHMAHVTICLDLLERVADPVALGATLADYTLRLLFVSLRTMSWGPWDGPGEQVFRVKEVPGLFPGMKQVSFVEYVEEGRAMWYFRPTTRREASPR